MREAPAPASTLCADGDPDTLKSRGPKTIRVTAALRVIAPLVACTDSGYVPRVRSGGADAATSTVSCEPPVPVMTAGANVAVPTDGGNPLTTRETSPSNPFAPVTETAYEALPPETRWPLTATPKP